MSVPNNWKAKGEKSEANIIAAFVDAEIPVFFPYLQQNMRCDFIIENEEGKLERIQAKTGRLRNGTIKFSTSSSSYQYKTSTGLTYGTKNYIGQIDAFAVYCPDTKKSYLVPINETPTKNCGLRVAPKTQKGGGKSRWAEDFEIKPKTNFVDQEFSKKESIPNLPCKKCGGLNNSRRGLYCSTSCGMQSVHEKNKTSARPDKNTLEKEIAAMTWTAVGKKYNVSDNAVRKWAKFYGMI